jgi:hypothetical protein
MIKQGASSQHDVQMEANGKFLGRMSAISHTDNTNNFDWALIKLDRKEILSSVGEPSQFGPIQSFVKSMPARARVQVITASSGIVKGTIFGIPTFMQQPRSVAFQEMWTVRLDGPLSKY